MVIEIFFTIAFIIFIVWLIIKLTKSKRPDNLKDLELELKEEFYEKEKEYLKQIQELKLEHKENISELEKKYAKQEKGHRLDAVKRSRNTLMGRLWETVAPYLYW